jgi:hypothetical protein
MVKSRSGAGLVCVLNLILALITAAAVYFGFVRQPARRGEDLRQAAMQIGGDFLNAVTGGDSRSLRTAAAYGETAEDGDVRDAGVYSAFLAGMTAEKERESAEDDRFAGLLSRLDASVRENRYEDAREIAGEMEKIAQQKSGDSRYLYLARSVSRLVENAGGQLSASGHEERFGALQEELSHLKAERDLYRRNLRDARAEQHLAESALALQESNAQIQQMLLDTLREQYEKSQDALSVARVQLDAGETLAIREARERMQAGYQEGIAEAQGLLEQSLRIRSRDSRIAFLNGARTRYPPGSAMVNLIDTLLERL